MKLNGRVLAEALPLRDLYEVYSEHSRLKVFAQKGRECVVCGREGVLLLVTESIRGNKHVDLYTEDFILMTVDHINPYSLSKDDTLSNKQPMCDPCNNKKGNKQITVEQMRELVGKRIKTGYTKKDTVVRMLARNNNIFNRTLSF